MSIRSTREKQKRHTRSVREIYRRKPHCERCGREIKMGRYCYYCGRFKGLW